MLESSAFAWTSSLDSFLDVDFSLDADFLPVEDDVDRLERLNISSCSASPVHSISTASSEAGDFSVDFLSGLDEDYGLILNRDPVLTNAVTTDGSFSDPFKPDYWDWESFSDDSFLLDLPWSESCSESSNVLNSPKRRKTSKISLSSKSWSEIENEERRKAIEALTQIISQKLKLNEKLEVIRIINPEAVVSPTDKEFVVDLACLNDTKFQRIKEYVQKRTFKTSQNCKERNKLRSNCSIKSDSSNSSSPSGKLKTSKSKERRNQMKALKERQRKEKRQLLKERRSGLFVHEEVLSLNTLSQSDDSDVDILD